MINPLTRHNFFIESAPFVYESPHLFQLPDPNSEFWVEKIGWRYEYIDIGMPNATRTPVKPIVVSLGNFFRNDGGAVSFCTDKAPIVKKPLKLAGFVNISIRNTNLENNHKLRVEIILTGSYKAACSCPTQTLMTSGCKCGGS